MSNSVPDRVAPPPGPPSEASVGELMTRLSEQTSRLVRDELALAQIELKDTAKQAGKGAGLLSGAGVLALYGLGAAVATAIIALALVLPLWASALIVTAVLFLAAGVAGLVGKKEVEHVSPTPQRTVDNVSRDVAEVQEARHRDHTRS
ncbi:phage holin family protein [Actinomycetospora lemnae]|uniref:Phage holin family protein n=1 Tax=Actinomycetospora lemnae TaxID=3019891 RepID=A0ABT5SZV7_9PSEU|nr:phage holin family protein [Actinomycetospora sp. DW7H6]MDD7968392.1 phage holin family protein [Actinomycetospora sp. DW7H6]